MLASNNCGLLCVA